MSEHFKGREGEAKRWDDLWAKGDFLPWDRAAPNPALVDTLSDRKDLLGSSPLLPNGQRKRAFVPGCGKGYDVLLFASFGYDAIGLESENAVKTARQWQKDHEQEYEVRNNEVGRGSVTFVTGNFFEQGWEKDIPGGVGDGFDAIYDYTVCSEYQSRSTRCWQADTLSHVVSLRASSSNPTKVGCTYVPASAQIPW